MGAAQFHARVAFSAASESGSATLAATAVIGLVFLLFAITSVRLSIIDVQTHRLPNAIVLPGYLVAGTLLVTATLLGSEPRALARAVAGMATLFVFYLAMRIFSPAGVGGGDVKLAGLIGLHLAWIGWGALIVGSLTAFILGGVYGIALIATRRGGVKTAIPFGPFMLGGAWIGVAAGGAAAAAFLPHAVR